LKREENKTGETEDAFRNFVWKMPGKWPFGGPRRTVKALLVVVGKNQIANVCVSSNYED
jgi:hypothetical protein